ncbi:MAG: glycosyltransferase family 9 protein [Candidatus Omnitrophica bacterium]|nr:glycosyltransferase family 9 protein [Candidatus Omnitrophota bacterium]
MINIKNILVIRTDRIGDVVLTTPAIKALRTAYPSSKITLLVAPLTYPLVCNNPDVDEVMVDDRRGEHSGWLGFLKLIMQIRRRKFDVVLVFHTKRRTNALAFFAGITLRCGYKDKNWGGLLNCPVVDTRTNCQKHEYQYCLDVLKCLDIFSDEKQLTVSVDEQSEKWAEIFLQNKAGKDQKLFLFHVGASDPARMWPEEHHVVLLKMLKNYYYSVVILIGNEQLRGIAASIKQKVPGMLDLTGNTSLSQLVSLIKRADLVVSNDSGPAHIAAAFDRPLVTIFTRNQPGINPERWHPLGSRSLFIAPQVDNSVSFLKAGTQGSFLSHITPDKVFSAIQELQALH